MTTLFDSDLSPDAIDTISVEHVTRDDDTRDPGGEGGHAPATRAGVATRDDEKRLPAGTRACVEARGAIQRTRVRVMPATLRPGAPSSASASSTRSDAAIADILGRS